MEETPPVMQMKLDKKFTGSIMKVKDGTVLRGDEWIVFLAKDNAFAMTLPTYRENCIKLGCDQEQIDAVDRLIANVEAWRKVNPKRCKNPDAAGEKMLP